MGSFIFRQGLDLSAISRPSESFLEFFKDGRDASSSELPETTGKTESQSAAAATATTSSKRQELL